MFVETWCLWMLVVDNAICLWSPLQRQNKAERQIPRTHIGLLGSSPPPTERGCIINLLSIRSTRLSTYRKHKDLRRCDERKALKLIVPDLFKVRPPR